jgi:hypothetical protein
LKSKNQIRIKVTKWDPDPDQSDNQDLGLDPYQKGLDPQKLVRSTPE